MTSSHPLTARVALGRSVWEGQSSLPEKSLGLEAKCSGPTAHFQALGPPCACSPSCLEVGLDPGSAPPALEASGGEVTSQSSLQEGLGDTRLHSEEGTSAPCLRGVLKPRPDGERKLSWVGLGSPLTDLPPGVGCKEGREGTEERRPAAGAGGCSWTGGKVGLGQALWEVEVVEWQGQEGL